VRLTSTTAIVSNISAQFFHQIHSLGHNGESDLTSARLHRPVRIPTRLPSQHVIIYHQTNVDNSMTSVSQPTQPPSSASNNNGASQSAQSYASATRKAVSSPPVATGSSSQSPAVAVGNVAPVQHGKSSSISPVNGRSSIPPAVPVVSTPAIASSNGNAMEHSRKSSVTINGGYVANGSSKAIQFGSLAESPAATHSTPQIAIPSNPRVTSPAQSPSPIPQPTASGGGRPPAGLQSAGMTFGSHPGGDGDVSIFILFSALLY
jgi:translation initiation factor 4G